ncbi:MAG: hypothetical protein ACI843_001931, partial [Psychrobacter glaciei]
VMAYVHTSTRSVSHTLNHNQHLLMTHRFKAFL